jgi:TPP-dependent indolepyruvate ferredoxin oxidoreductase alpha subunit
MAGPTLTVSSVMQCPHGGIVKVVPSNTRALSGGSPILTTADIATVIGCSFVAGVVPSPCVQVRWVMGDAKGQAGAATLSQSCVGLCMNAAGVPQGPVVISGGSPNLATR